MQQSSNHLLISLLKHYFGFDFFRPLQQEIITDSLLGKDTIALLPTGGGKSLCYQLRSLAAPGLTIVISPLIALMKDQVDALSEQGIQATFLNSSLSREASAQCRRRLENSEYRLLYVAPERLALDGMLEQLERWQLSFIAVDEAHCISEWGHDFRPEYRQLSLLRDRFPDVPIMALTATATLRVRNDISQLLKLRSPASYVASFNRPNLSYRIIQRDQPLKQLIEVIRDHPGESGIIYCLSRAGTERIAQALNAKGFSALAYHAGLDAEERTKRQEQFINDEVPIIAATIAFGMGIDKPDVRYVIHHDLPKNLESYYQETGRAGRDGLPSECVMLYSAGDAVKLHRFIDELSSPQERDIARDHLRSLLRFAESSTCRRIELLRYFGEQYLSPTGAAPDFCGACDNCLTPRPSFDGTLAAQKILSCAVRIKQKSGFSVGLLHLVDVLCGAKTEKVAKFGHDSLSTYAIGKDRPRAEWLSYANELIQLGLLQICPERFNVAEVTESGAAVLRGLQFVELHQPLVKAGLSVEKRKLQRRRTGHVEVDPVLFGALRRLRLDIAREIKLPAYLIFSDATLQQMALLKPKSEAEMLQVSGVGDVKLKRYGARFLQVINNS